jgi:UDP-N-acetylmuramoyl-L-alanyl-D-glutamate--2,6-diaminopimelate ligase
MVVSMPVVTQRSSVVTGIGYDSRMIKPGMIFVAITGFKEDGHRYIDSAIERGACALFGEQEITNSSVPYIRVTNSRLVMAHLAAVFFADPTRKLYTVGVTGTNGKTTTAHLTASLLGKEKTALISTVTNEGTAISTVTTPESPYIHEYAYHALQSGKENFVLEVSSIAGVLYRTARIDFDVALFTNFSRDHLDFYESMEAYRHAKVRLGRELKPAGRVIANIDDPVGRTFLAISQAKPLSYSIDSNADLMAKEILLSRNRSQFTISYCGEEVRVSTRLIGRYNVYNALAAVAVGLDYGLSLADAGARLEHISPVAGRFERYRTHRGAMVIIDFAHSPDALEKTLKMIREIYRPVRIICLFGCGGESDSGKRPVMGEIAGRLADYTIITTDNPKSEDPEEIIAQIEAGIVRTSGEYARIIDRKSAIRQAIALAESDDIVLIAGKGHEQRQIFKDRAVAYSDYQFLVDAELINQEQPAQSLGS